MSKVLKTVGTVVGAVGVAVAVVASGGTLLTGFPIAASLFGISASAMIAASGALAIGASLLAKKPSISANATDRLYASLDPNAARKMAFGDTALPAQVLFSDALL